ncbi:hypothetical protein ONZ45_g6803 [Pleurotus djamor]|nr:hypothetical protein ONZ45_g6803 [Pleurotus djamor]
MDAPSSGAPSNLPALSVSAGSSAFRETLNFITDIKLQELDKQQAAYDAHLKVISDAASVSDPIQRVEMFLKAIRDWTGSGSVKGRFPLTIDGMLDLDQLEIWIAQSKKDPCVSPVVVEGWIKILESHIKYNATRFEYASLFGKLLKEWMSSGDSVTGFRLASLDAPLSNDLPVVNDRAELTEQKERLQKLIFQPSDVDVAALKAYLEDLFSSVDGKQILKEVREEMKEHSYNLRHYRIDADDVRWTIDSVIESDLMSEEKRITLKQMRSNRVVLEELASVLTMRMADLEAWSWPKEGVEIEMRRALNGKYRAFTDPDIVNGLFLEFIGITWQKHFKKAFTRILNSIAWQPSVPAVPPAFLQRRRRFIKSYDEKPLATLEAARVENRKEHFFMSQLADLEPSSGRKSYDGSPLQAINTKQRLINMLMTDCHINTVLHKSHTVVRTDFEWFGPSLPHETVSTVLEFFGVSGSWLKFFKAFLAMPVRFKDDPESIVRTRTRGTPISYAISQLQGEVVLFISDYGVNQRAEGLYLYRLHDDVWFWDARSARCEKAWEEINKFTSLAGLALNQEKTGSACVGGTLSSKLPTGDVKWGFLKFDADKARFVINQDDVTLHIAELQRQLAATKSIFGWVNVYNKYMAFFRRNFGGRPPFSFGQAHFDDIVDTFARIQHELFPDHPGGALEYLRSLVGSRMGVSDIPDGYFYFPASEGGLELRNPMIEAFALRRTESDILPKELQNPDDFLEPLEKVAKEAERDASMYNEFKAKWENDQESYMTYSSRDSGTPPKEFMSFEEYTQYREQFLGNWHDLYETMMHIPSPRCPTIPSVLQARLPKMKRSDFYSDWVVALYGHQLLEKFGGMKLVDARLIPIGMVELFKTAKLKWDQ